MTKTILRLSWSILLLVCIITLSTSCSDTGSSSQQSTIEITSISPDSGKVGSKVTIQSNSIDPKHNRNQIELNGIDVPILSYGSNSLRFKVPEGATSGPVTLSVGGKVANGPYFKVLTEKPQIEAITPAYGGPGTQVTITGNHFLPPAMMATVPGDSTVQNPGSMTDDSLQSDTTGITLKANGEPGTNINGLPVSVSFGNQLAPLLSLSATKIIVEVPENASSSSIELTVGSRRATSTGFTLLRQPLIDEVIPKTGPIGTKVTIHGHHFSSQPDSNQVLFNDTPAIITHTDSTKLITTVPQKATSGLIKVTSNGQTITGPTFTLSEAPEPQVTIQDINPKAGPAGTTVTISGTNFSPTATKNIVTFNGTQATVNSASTTELVTNVPNNATSGPVTVKVGTQTATGPTFTVGNNAAPTITGEGSFEIEENSSEVGTITASDPDGDALTFSLSGGADQGQFNIDQDSGALIFSTIPDFENPADADADNIYQVEVKVSDGNVSVTKTITITVTNVDEAPVMVSPDILLANENSTDAGTIDANDPEGNAITYNITGGTDAKALTLDQNSGKLTFNTAPNFENPADANTDNSYEAEVTISDGSFSLTKILDITVQDVNEAPVITGAGPFTIEENTATVGTITASDPDGDALDFALLGGTKGTLTFSSDANSGEISISPAPDFETPRDDNGDNTYELDLNVNDGALGTSQQVSITVTNVVEVPTINRGVIRPATTESYSLNSTNEEYIYRFDPVPAGTDLQNILNFSLGTSLTADLATSATVTGGTDGGLFSVNSINQYAIHIDGPSSLDYNHSADGNAHEYRFTITASNAGGTTPTYTIIIPVQNPFPQGSGTATDPYQVETIDQLQVVNQFLDAHLVQTADIDASATAGWNGGQGFKPISDLNNQFSGSYDGNGHTINGLTMDRNQGTIYGLFGAVSSGGQISNVQLINIDITTEDTVGGLAGINQGTITNSYVSGTITNSISGTTGGLVGENSGAIRRSYSLVNVNGRANVGGLVGTNYAGTITNSYARGNVSASYTIAGGLVGNNKGIVEHSYATGAISGSNSLGGLVGYEDTRFASATATESYWDTQTTGLANSDGGTGLTTSQMQGSTAQTNMTGFDFGTVWTVNPNEYPILIGVGGQ
ncbi:IPT/TIG domain-containing protein [Aliifodinibius salicampi]|uniref:IPT/TIG domain-containing protein n=1 Tax=Fodinibius salicampi TaxID=1920655 RepID=A0ABT3Q2Y2_9BACT|nr:IPT/TIG domain-containing protein [Fodinibius salicampi]MCW9714461.1 IPT/TIG domain-containing protein [Fodinibius salicampi]